MRRKRRVKTFDATRQALISHHATSGSWRATGAAYGLSGAMACMIATRGYEPRSARIRNALGLPPNVSLNLVDDTLVYEGSQVGASSRFCRCRQPFIPNTPTRIRCFICSPSRARRRS